MLSWLNGFCSNCGHPIVVTQPDHVNFPTDDYWWYCANKMCKHHHPGTHTGDMEWPGWLKTASEVARELAYEVGSGEGQEDES